MDQIGWLVFIERIVGHLAWPVAIIFASIMFRGHIVRILGRLKSVRHRDTELTFAEQLDEASQEAASLPGVVEVKSLDGELLSSYPHLAISEAWRRIENEVASIVSAEWPRLPERDVQGVRGIRHLEKLELADKSLIRLIHDLRRIRNEAIHSWDGDITVGQATEYVSLATRVEKQLAEIAKSVPRQ